MGIDCNSNDVRWSTTIGLRQTETYFRGNKIAVRSKTLHGKWTRKSLAHRESNNFSVVDFVLEYIHTPCIYAVKIEKTDACTHLLLKASLQEVGRYSTLAALTLLDRITRGRQVLNISSTYVRRPYSVATFIAIM